MSGFSLSFKLQSLDAASSRSVIWSVDYATGSSPTSFTTVATSPSTLTTGSSAFSNNTVTVNFGSALDHRSENVWIRIVALTASTGTGNRPTTGIDDFTLNYSSGGSDLIPPAVLSLYNRRKAGADELRTLLNTAYGSDNVIVLGDFNVDLDQTITAGITPPTTSYISFVNDSGNFPPVTLPLSRSGKKSTTGFSDP